jgi:two-component system chemotaxis response regulator CheB
MTTEQPTSLDGRAIRNVVVVGASAGGVEALSRFVGALPRDLAATVLVVLHIPAGAPSALAAILDRHGRLRARTAGEDEPLRHRQIVVAPPDYHLVVDSERTTTIVHGPRENGHRPSIDVLFRTAAVHLGPRVVAVVLSGSDDDGTVGALAVRERGGLVFTQSKDDALYATMPVSVERRAGSDGQASAAGLAALVADAVRLAVPASPADAQGVAVEGRLEEEAAVDEDRQEAVLGEPLGTPSGYVCPDCSGALFTVSEAPVLRFRCRIGHAWTADGLVAQQALTVETALWTAVRTLQERADLSERLAKRAADEGRRVSAHQFHRAAHDARASARTLQELLASAAGEQLVEGDAAASEGAAT